MWEKLKGFGAFLFSIGIIMTWAAFFAPYINRAWTTTSYQLWQWGAMLIVASIGVFAVGWGLGALGGIRFGRRYKVPIPSTKPRRIAKIIAAVLILSVAVWGVVTYGPGIAEWIGEQTSGALSVSEVVEHSNKYLNQQITVKGQLGVALPQYLDNENRLSGYMWESTGTVYHILWFENAPPAVPLAVNSWYKFTGILRINSVARLDVIRVEPA